MDRKSYIKNVGQIIKRERIACGHTMPKLAKMARISKGGLSKIEGAGTNITLDTLLKIAGALVLRPEELLPDENHLIKRK
jgi:transcriptional regulator with XRE-family HTH domain